MITLALGSKLNLYNQMGTKLIWFPDFPVQVNYWLSDIPVTKIEMQEAFLFKISGGICADYEANSYSYSSLTEGTDYDTTLTIGGHNLFMELRKEQGRFIILEINVMLTKPTQP